MTEADATVGHSASAAEAALQIDAIRRESGAGRRLAEMLPEESPVYAGRGSSEAERLRGYILASFEATGLPPEAAPLCSRNSKPAGTRIPSRRPGVRCAELR